MAKKVLLGQDMDKAADMKSMAAMMKKSYKGKGGKSKMPSKGKGGRGC